MPTQFVLYRALIASGALWCVAAFPLVWTRVGKITHRHCGLRTVAGRSSTACCQTTENVVLQGATR